MNNQIIQKEFPLLSVVIKAYNIEKELLDRCVLSAVQQTYTNLEILLVNNASTDDTGIYCDEWSDKDNRIKVIHNHENAFDHKILSNITGDYLHILDHDDWIDPNMYSKMMSAMLSTNSDIARCEYCLTYPDGRIVQRNITHNADNVEILGREEAVMLLLENTKWDAFFWQNIFKKHLFAYLTYSKEKVFGDLVRTHILFHHASQTVYLHDVLYFYYQRHGSTINPCTKPKQKYIDYCRCNSIYARYLFVIQNPQYHGILQIVKKDATREGLITLWNMIDYPQIFPDNAYETQIERLKKLSFSIRDGIFFVLNFDLWILKRFTCCYKSYYWIFWRNLKRIKRLIKYVT